MRSSSRLTIPAIAKDSGRSSQSMRKGCLVLTNNPRPFPSTRHVFFYGLPSYSFRRWSPTNAASGSCLYFGEHVDIILSDSLKILIINASAAIAVGSLDTGQVCLADIRFRSSRLPNCLSHSFPLSFCFFMEEHSIR